MDIAPELENLSENLQIGGKVKIRTKKGISKGNFTILGYSLRSNEYTLQSLETGELVTIDKKYVITKFSSLEDPNKLKISEDIKLEVDELPSIKNEFKIEIKDDAEYFNEIAQEEGAEEFMPKPLNYEDLTSLNLEEDDEEDDEENEKEEKRTVQKLSVDDTDKNLRLLAFKEEEKNEDDEDDSVDYERK